MYIAVCDDQAEELELLIDLLFRWKKERRVALQFKSYRSATELLTAASNEQFTLYFLDVMMPGIDGMAAAREIRSFDDVADIVFLTSSPGFAYESYGVRAMDYLLKPIRAEILFSLLDRILSQEQKPQEGLTLKTGATLIRIPFYQLAYVEVMGKHLYFNLTDGSVREVFGALKDYEPLLLKRSEFMRTHRSYIVNMLQVSELSTAGVHTFSGKQLPVSRLLYPQLQKDYMQLMFSERGENL
ncbi:MAG: LytR/AlgR family response regulator transcription factor [Lachnospira sp.]